MDAGGVIHSQVTVDSDQTAPVTESIRAVYNLSPTAISDGYWKSLVEWRINGRYRQWCSE